MLPMLALGALSLGGSLLSGMGAAQASKKQARMQMIADAQAREANEATLERVNAQREALGRELLTIPEERGGWVDVDAMNAAAERGGFNPVTFMQGGGLAAYSRSWTIGHNAADAFKLMAPEYALANASQVPQQHSMLSALGSGLSAAGTAMGTQYRADQSYDLNMSKLDMAWDQMQMGLSASNGLSTARILSGGGGGGGGSGAVGGLSASVGGVKSSGKDETYWPGYEQPGFQLWDAKKPESTNPFAPSLGWTIPPGFANAEAYEDSLGEGVSIPYGLWKGANIVSWNLTGKTIPGHFEAAREQVQAWKSAPSWTAPVTPYAPFAGAYPSWASP